MIKQVIWASMVDYPSKISSVLFFGGCNFNCKYCYNKELIKMQTIDFDKEIIPKLLSRKSCVSHIILSGGECTLNSEFEEVLDKLYFLGFKIGLHTNASLPNVIEKNIDKIDYLGIDIKTVKEKYNNLTNIPNFDFNKIIKTIKIAIDNNKQYECRTTLFPNCVNLENCLKIAETLKEVGVKEYVLQKYYPIGSADIVTPYTDEYIDNIRIECNKILPTRLKVK